MPRYDTVTDQRPGAGLPESGVPLEPPPTDDPAARPRVPWLCMVCGILDASTVPRSILPVTLLEPIQAPSVPIPASFEF